MFYDKSEIAELLNCQHCEQPYSEYEPPRILPCCGKTICDKCVNSIRIAAEKTYKCIVCAEFCTMSGSKGFLVNELIAKLVTKQPKEVSRGKEATKFKSNLQDLNSLAIKLLFETDNGEYIIKEECRELKRQIQLAK